jgi:predicted DNA-binding protein with PD1-like motif
MSETAVMRQVNPQGTRVFMGTLTGKANVHEALAQLAQQHAVQTATFELLGGLHEVELTAYDFEQKRRLAPLVWQRPLEIIAGHGTISQLDGQPHVHLHLTLAFRDEAAPQGITVIGGHAARAMAFAVEFTLTAYDGDPVHRAIHQGTGLMLWQI